MTHKIKLLDVFADAVYNGEKMFEVRQNDRNYQRGDYVKFSVVHDNGETRDMVYHKLNDALYEITYVLSGWGLKDGYVAFGMRRIPTLRERLEGIGQ